MGFLWFGIGSALALMVVGALAWKGLSANAWAKVAFLFAAIPGMITYAVSVLALVRRLRFWSIAVALLLPWPRVFVLVVCVAPFAYMAWLLIDGKNVRAGAEEDVH
ncbi:hypothetical protein LYSHEL_27250 [Lysobacter helvus]|uniref:Uncharacterized protein n=2 Tax=Lysobacteraceae TaxID=32033 RepID=A0ABM7Q8D4_9GAMM|nr:hypothetical protein LYSCAS_27220 [Lysobacter caseinilyticus]BCT96854.1 hypothetical protein LYSHEL_27250 [Lysobacter helvus]